MARTQKPSRPQVPVVRDMTFHRSVADKVVVIDLGRDAELAFLQAGPTITKMVDVDDETEQARLDGTLTEVARVRVSGPVALTLAVSVIETFISAGKLKTEALLESLGKYAAEHESEAKQ